MLSPIVVHDFDWTKLAAISSILASSSTLLYRLAMYSKKDKDKQQEDKDKQQELINSIRELLAYLKQKDQNDEE